MRLNRRGSPVGAVRTRSACCAVAIITLVAPLVGCGATDQSASAADGKAGGSAPAEPVVLRMLNPTGEWESEEFVKQVQSLSGGSLRIEAVDHWHEDTEAAASRESDAIDEVRAGTAPLGLTAVRAWHDKGVPSFDALLAPLLIDRGAVQTAVLHSDIASEMLDGLDGSGLTGIGILPGPFQHPVGVTRDLLDVSDYQGASIAIPPGAVLARSVESLGATPTASFFGGASVAGFDGFEQQLTSVQGNGYDDPARSVTVNVTVRPRPLVLYGNADALAGLSEENRALLRQAAQAAIDAKAATDIRYETEDLAVLCRRDEIALINASAGQLDDLRSAYEPVYQWLREDPATAGFLDRIRQIADDIPVDPADATPDCQVASSVPTGSAAPTASADTSPVDGTYRSTVTKEQAAAAGGGGNWGETVLVIDHGRFAHAGHNDRDCTWAYGTVTLDGDTMTWNYQDGGGHGAANRPGEQLAFRWSLYRDVLSLTNAPGAISPVPEGASWDLTRTGDPDPSALDPQCPPPTAAFPH